MFAKYLFAVPLMKGDADLEAKALTSIFFRHSYIPSTIICDLGTAIISELLVELAKGLEARLKNYTQNRTNDRASRKASCAFETNTINNRNPKLNRLASLPRHSNFYTQHSVFPALGYTPDVFHGRTPVNPLDRRFQNTTTMGE